MHRLDNRVPPPILLLMVAGLMFAASRYGPAWSLDPTLRYGAAGVLAAAGIAFNASGFRAIRRAGSTIDPTRPSAATALVVDGPFRITRNPMYVGFTLMLLAWAVYLSSPIALVGPVCFAGWVTRFQIVPEESALRAKFGNAFDDYAKRVRRWL